MCWITFFQKLFYQQRKPVFRRKVQWWVTKLVGLTMLISKVTFNHNKAHLYLLYRLQISRFLSRYLKKPILYKPWICEHRPTPDRFVKQTNWVLFNVWSYRCLYAFKSSMFVPMTMLSRNRQLLGNGYLVGKWKGFNHVYCVAMVAGKDSMTT